MKKAPVILIGPSNDPTGAEFEDRSLSLSETYPAAVLAAGGLPWVVPCLTDRQALAEAVGRSAGVMLTGGDDLSPCLYTKRLPSAVRRTIQRTDPARDLFELLLIEEVFRQRKPLLAICRGHQMLNVALGGTLYADIKLQRPQSLNHRRTDRKDRVVHELTCAGGSLLRQVAGRDRFRVNSAHHQAVAGIAKPFRATAVSNDGIVECLELAPGDVGLLPWVLSVQFHPERLFARHEEHWRVFAMFVRACQRSGPPNV